MSWLGRFLAVWVLLLLGGCDQRALIKKFTPEVDDRLARQFIAELVDGHEEAAVALLHPALRNSAGYKGTDQLIGIFQQGKINSIEVVGAYQVFNTKTGTEVQLSYQLHLSSGWFVGNIVTKAEGAARYITTARFQPMATSLDIANALTFSGKGLVHYAFILLVLAVPAFCITTLVVCARSRIGRKWAWILFILVGIGVARLNWTTGALSFQPMYVMLLGGGMFREGIYGAWTVCVGAPIGAVVFLIRRQTLIANRTAALTPPPPPSSSPPLLPST